MYYLTQLCFTVITQNPSTVLLSTSLLMIVTLYSIELLILFLTHHCNCVFFGQCLPNTLYLSYTIVTSILLYFCRSNLILLENMFKFLCYLYFHEWFISLNIMPTGSFMPYQWLKFLILLCLKCIAFSGRLGGEKWGMGEETGASMWT